VLDTGVGYRTGETWTVEIDGVEFSKTLPEPSAPELRTVGEIARLLVEQINTSALYSATYEVTTGGVMITITDRAVDAGLSSLAGDDPFTLVAGMQAGKALGVFDIDFATPLQGTSRTRSSGGTTRFRS
jgi:hypothetical protein